jgi:hypothetical protein
MLKLARLVILVLSPLAFGAAWYLLPELLEPSALKWLSGIFAFAWTVELLVLRMVDGLSTSVGSLTSREQERLVYRLGAIRKRVLWMGAVSICCTVLGWVLATLGLPAASSLYAAAFGFLVGVSLSYLVLMPFWYSEAQGFLEKIRLQADTDARRQATVKSLQG